MQKKHLFWILLLNSALFAICPVRFVQSDLILVEKSGQQCVISSKEDVNVCVESFKFKDYVFSIQGVEHSMVVWNDSIAFLNVVLSFTEAKNYCIDKNGVHDVEYEAPIGKTVIK